MQGKLEGRGTGDETQPPGFQTIEERGAGGAGSCGKPIPSKRWIAEDHHQSSALCVGGRHSMTSRLHHKRRAITC